MAVSALSSTTLTNAILKSDKDNIVVGSTTNITAGAILALAGRGGVEIVKAQAVPVSGQVNVIRGQYGTRARDHVAGTVVYIASTDGFKVVRDNAAALVGDSASLPDYCIPGTRARDASGNEYVMVDLTFSAFAGVAVLISKDGNYTAKALASGDYGSVGIMAEEGTSDQWAWAQVYGYAPYVQLTSGSSLMTSTGLFQPATTASTPAGGLLGRTTSQASSEALARVLGIFPSSAATTATTAATSATGFSCTAFLNYPFLERAMSS